MTPDEARNLLGGYATGSLTEAERKVLFDAALEDQELFDELAGEQVLKEVLDEPGARQRLITALEPPRRRAWLWGWAGAAATLVIVVGVVVSQRTPAPPQQIAQVMKSHEPAVAPAAPAAPAPAPAVRKVSPPSPPPPQPPAEDALADQLQLAKPQVAEAARGFVAGAPEAAALRAQSQAISVSAFAFNYAVRADGFLVIVPAARGFLSVTAKDAVIFPSGAVSAGTPVQISIPPDATSLVIGFSREQGITGSPVRRDGASGTVTDQDPPNARILIELFLTRATQ